MAGTPHKQAVVKTALAAATMVVVLLVYRRFVEPAKGIDPGIFAKAFQPGRKRPAETPVPETSLHAVQQPTQPLKRETISPYLMDDDGALDGFFAALHGLQAPSSEAAQPDVVTVLHYGDSPTTADLITGDVRAELQQRFGDAGHGYLLTGKPWAWYGHRDTDISDEGWSISTAVGKGHEESYGLGGASFEGGTGAKSHVTLKGAGQSSMEMEYLGRPGGGSVSVVAGGALLGRVETAAEVAGPAWTRVTLPADAAAVDMTAQGQVRLYGESFLTGRRGVIYDSLGLNGASTSVLSNGFNAGTWQAELRHAKPSLVIINYGTNESGFGSYVDKQYEPTLRHAIERIRVALPAVPILIMSPMDRGRRSGVDEIATYDTIPRLVATERRVAAEMHCAFFDTFHAMGGEGTMARWYTGHPRLVAGDLIHPTPQGAKMVADLLVRDLLLGYGRWQKANGKAVSFIPAPAPGETPGSAIRPETPVAPQKKPSPMTPVEVPVEVPVPVPQAGDETPKP